MEVAVLLSLMIASSAEDIQLYTNDGDIVREVQLKSDVLLENVHSVKKQIKVGIFFLWYSFVLYFTQHIV